MASWRLSLEHGGNAPFIVLPDADFDFVAEQFMRLKLFVSGQVCITANRVFVHAEAALAEKLAEIMQKSVDGGIWTRANTRQSSLAVFPEWTVQSMESKP